MKQITLHIIELIEFFVFAYVTAIDVRKGVLGGLPPPPLRLKIWGAPPPPLENFRAGDPL